MDEISIKDFLETEYSNSALYNCYRAIASYVDGLKPSARKVVYTIKKRNMTQEMKVSRFASSVANSLSISMERVACRSHSESHSDFVGSNNLPSSNPTGTSVPDTFPASSAARYIFTQKSEEFDKMFNKADDAVLISQEFEGAVIEPKYYVPILPLLLVNGSEGMGTGFARRFCQESTYLVPLLSAQGDNHLPLPSQGVSGRAGKGTRWGLGRFMGSSLSRTPPTSSFRTSCRLFSCRV